VVLSVGEVSVLSGEGWELGVGGGVGVEVCVEENVGRVEEDEEVNNDEI